MDEGLALVRSGRRVPRGHVAQTLDDCRLAAAVLSKDQDQAHDFPVLLDKVHDGLVFVVRAEGSEPIDQELLQIHHLGRWRNSHSISLERDKCHMSLSEIHPKRYLDFLK